ncbi:Hypothetical_protein [Hexamita inflata]|uniref:Hypothetical_protein n=1 Tax=Hexamita inflata TaxID=28002 RepID=A0AA86V2S8_9EUKA|nr:Hypothetical protein HINF_LOCUS61607 [Hexamita inflata]
MHSRVNEPEQEETDQRVMTLLPALNLEALRVAADTLVPRFIPAIPKIVTKITSEVNNVSSSAEGCLRRQFRVTILDSLEIEKQTINCLKINCLYIQNVAQLQPYHQYQ